MKRSPYLILLSLALLALLAACGQPSAQSTVNTPVPAPTATLMSGWKRFENKGVSIALPDTFVGGDFTTSDQEAIAEKFKQLGSEFEQMAKLIKDNPELYLFFGMDTEPTKSGVFTNVNVVHEKVLSIVDPVAYMKAAEKQLPAQFKIMSRDEITLFGEPAGKIVVGLTLADKNMKEVMYLFKRGNYMHVVTYVTGRDEFEEKLPMFEQSLQTLTLSPAP